VPAALRILIVGGGIAGLGLGRALRQQGVVPDIIERVASWPSAGTGLYIPGNGVRALEALGLADQVLARAVRMSHQRLLDHTGRPLAEIELARVWGGVGPCVGIARSELHRVLLESIAGVRVRLGTSLTALSQHDDMVHVVFTDGSTGTYDLVVGADGIHSWVRRLVIGHIPPRHLGQVSWRFLVEFSGAVDTWTAMLGPRLAFLAMPIGPNRLYCYADLATFATEDPTEGDLARLRALFADFAKPVPGILGELGGFDAIHFAPIEEIALDSSGRGRVLLIGDAAHATSPNMAEGASMALEDALVLARMLRTHGSPEASVSAFSERRRARIRWVQQRTHRRDRVRTLPAPLRNLALKIVGTRLYRRDYQPLLDDP
jgi:2-polyprenyl-6-methoxyphenol hydroxylase-like FAD-dependent oxidoreductase